MDDVDPSKGRLILNWPSLIIITLIQNITPSNIKILLFTSYFMMIFIFTKHDNINGI